MESNDIIGSFCIKIHMYTELILSIFRLSFSTDPCEYENTAHSNLAVVQNLVIRLLDYQKKARLPPWYPPRDSLADPALLGGSWGPWKAIDSSMSRIKGQNRTASHTGKTASDTRNEINKHNDNSKHLHGFHILRNITGPLRRGTH